MDGLVGTQDVTLSQLELIPTQNLFGVKQETPQRFEQPMNEKDFERSIAGRIPQNTQSNTKWALNIFKEWRMWRNFRSDTVQDSHWPIPTLEQGSLPDLEYWLSRFICEVKRQDGSPYPPGKSNLFQTESMSK